MTDLQQQRVVFWLAIALAVAALFYLLGAVLAPFLAGLALAYILNPFVDRLESWYIPRTFGATLALLFAVAMVGGLFLLLLPVLLVQLADIIAKLPDYIGQVQMFLTKTILTQELFGFSNVADNIPALLSKGNVLFSKELATNILSSLWSGGQAFLGLISFLIITPIVTIYMLRDWKKIIAFVDRLLPVQHASALRQVAAEIDEALSASLRGQVSVCLLLATFYGVALQLLGLDFGLLIGIVSGFISFIPYAGAIFGFLFAFQAGLFQFWPDWQMALMICGSVFVVGQALEGYVLTPKLVGEKVGLHALWVIFALVAFGALWGFAGLLIALPLAASLGVLLRHMLRSYRDSDFYQT